MYSQSHPSQYESDDVEQAHEMEPEEKSTQQQRGEASREPCVHQDRRGQLDEKQRQKSRKRRSDGEAPSDEPRITKARKVSEHDAETDSVMMETERDERQDSEEFPDLLADIPMPDEEGNKGNGLISRAEFDALKRKQDETQMRTVEVIAE
ncbi:hypothetical protein BKA81DRAFT_432021 [Phyllosticta paracitricarpa]